MNDTIIINGKFNQSALSTEKFNDTVVTVSIEGIIEDTMAVVSDGEFTATIPDQGSLAARDYYNITVSPTIGQTTSENYILDTNTIENIVIVEKAHIVADQASVVTVIYGMNDTITIKGNFNQSIGVNAVKFNNTKVTVSIAGIVYTTDASVVDGEFTAVITDQGNLTANGSGYDIIVYANSQTIDENYTLDENTINNIVFVEKANVTAVALDNITITYGVEDTITLHGVFNQSIYGDVKYEGVVNVSIRDKSGNIMLINESVNVGDGVFDAVFTDKGKLSVGYYDVYVTRDDGDVNANYTVVENSFVNNVTVVKAQADATFDGAVVVYGPGSITMNGTVVKHGYGVEYTGSVTVTIGTHDYNGYVVDGILSVYVDDLSVFAAGSYNVTIIGNNDNYTVNELKLTDNVTVEKAPSVVELDKYAVATYYRGGKVNVTVINLVNASGVTAELYKGSVNLANVSGNTIIVNTNELNAGKYTLKVATVVDGNHTSNTTEATITVNKVPSTIDDIDPISIVYGESGSVTVVCDGAIGINATLYKGTTEITGKLNVSEFVVTINADGLDVGEYTLTVTTIPDVNHIEESKSTNVTVTKTNSTIGPISPITLVYGDSGSVSVVTTGATGVNATLFNGTVEIAGKVSVDGNVVTVSASDLDVGEYTLKVTTVPDGNHNAVGTETNVTVTKAGSSIVLPENITVDYGGSINVTVAVENATGIAADLFNGAVTVKNLTVVGNVIVLDVSGLEIGNYVLRATTLTDANHVGAADEAAVSVVVHDADLKVFVESSIKVDQSLVVNVTVDSRATGKANITVNGVTKTVELVDAKGSAEFTGFAAGVYTVVAEYSGDGEFEPDYATAEFVVSNYNAADLQALIDEAIANNQTSITLDHDYVFDDGEDVPVVIAGPIAIDGNGHTIDASGTSGIFSIVADDVSLSNMDLTDVNGTAVVSTGDDTVISGIGLSDIDGTGIKLSGDGALVSDVDVSDLTGYGIVVSGEDAIVDGVDISDVDGVGLLVSGDDASVNDISVSDSTGTGIVISGDDASVDDISVSDCEGTGIVIYGDGALVSDVEVINNDGIGIVIAGDDAVVSDVEVIGNNGTAMVIDGDDAVVVDSSFIGNTAETAAGILINGDGATINGCEFADNVADAGTGIVVNGDYTSVVNSTFEGNNASEYAAVILVGPEGDVYVDNVTAVNNTVAGKEDNTIITRTSSVSIDVVDTVEGQPITVTVNVDGIGDFAFDGNVTIFIDNLTFTQGVTDGKSVFIVPGTLSAGLYDVVALYSGDSHRGDSSASAVLGVLAKTTIVAGDITRGYNSPYDFVATFTDKYGAALSNATVSFVVDGVTYNATTDADGVAYLAAVLPVVNDTATNYTVVVVNDVTGENATFISTIVPRLIVCSGNLTADYLENPPYVLQAIGDDGNPVGAGEFVRVVFAGFFYDMVTNETGHVVRTIGLAPGMYAVRGEYMGYKTPQTVFTVKQVMKVTSGTLKKTAKSYTLKATLKSSNGKAIVGKVVKLTFNGKTYTVKTNSKGVASYTIKSSVISKLKAGKTYALKAKYVNDVVKGKIKVVKK